MEFSLEHPLGFTIERDLRIEFVENIDQVKTTDLNNGYVQCALPISVIYSQRVSILLCFNCGALDSVTFALVERSVGKVGPGWNSVFGRETTADTGQWLSNNGHELGDFSWGEVWSGYNEKSGFSGAGVRYKSKS